MLVKDFGEKGKWSYRSEGGGFRSSHQAFGTYLMTGLRASKDSDCNFREAFAINSHPCRIVKVMPKKADVRKEDGRKALGGADFTFLTKPSAQISRLGK